MAITVTMLRRMLRRHLRDDLNSLYIWWPADVFFLHNFVVTILVLCLWVWLYWQIRCQILMNMIVERVSLMCQGCMMPKSNDAVRRTFYRHFCRSWAWHRVQAAFRLSISWITQVSLLVVGSILGNRLGHGRPQLIVAAPETWTQALCGDLPHYLNYRQLASDGLVTILVMPITSPPLLSSGSACCKLDLMINRLSSWVLIIIWFVSVVLNSCCGSPQVAARTFTL